MTKTQLKVLWVGIGIIVLMSLFPPSKSGHYHFLLEAYSVGLSQLFVQWVIIATISGGLIYSLKVDPELLLKIRCRILTWLLAKQPYEELLKSEREKRKAKQGSVPPENSDK